MVMIRTRKARGMSKAQTSPRSWTFIGTTLAALALAGCSEGTSSTGTGAAKPAGPAGVESSTTHGKSGKPKLDTTSRRQHQKQLTGQAPASN